MSVDDAFEAIVIDQLPPDDWYHFGLDIRFSNLEAVSELGAKALNLEIALEQAEIEVVQLREDIVKNSGQSVRDDEVASAVETLEQRRQRHWLFSQIYNRITHYMDSGFDYFDAIEQAANRQMREIKELDYLPENTRKKLLAAARQVVQLYALEDSEHFQDYD